MTLTLPFAFSRTNFAPSTLLRNYCLCGIGIAAGAGLQYRLRVAFNLSAIFSALLYLGIDPSRLAGHAYFIH